MQLTGSFISRRRRRLLLRGALALVAVVCASWATPARAQGAATHPRLLVTQADVVRLRGWAVPANPWWNDLVSIVGDAKTLMDNGTLMNGDNGFYASSGYPSEEYAEMFAF